MQTANFTPVNPRVWANAPESDIVRVHLSISPLHCEYCGESGGFHHIACPIAVSLRVRSLRPVAHEYIVLEAQ